tara:strand:- start:1093 stop:2136 length:1044 start_codon:yes stop_codon:yes gene_type:complete
MKLKNKYIIGTHVMFYEIDMLDDLVQSILNASESVENKQNITIDFLFNMSEYFEKIDNEQIEKDKLEVKFFDYLTRLRNFGFKIQFEIYTDDKPLTMVDYRRDLNYNNCKKYDYIIWGESDAMVPKELFQSLEIIRDHANENNIHRYITTFAVRKMWDASWKLLEHPEFTDKPYYETKHPDGSRNNKAFEEPHSIRYTMSIDEMNAVNSKTDHLDIRVLNKPQFDGSILCISSDLIKNGVNIPHCIFGHLVDDTSMMYSCQQIMGDAYVQFVVKNILKVHNRMHPKKRLYALDMDRSRKLTDVDNSGKGEWFHRMKELVHHNLNNFGSSQARFNTYKDFEKIMENNK